MNLRSFFFTRKNGLFKKILEKIPHFRKNLSRTTGALHDSWFTFYTVRASFSRIKFVEGAFF